MIGLLLSLGLLGGAAAKVAYDNYDMKKYTSRYDEKGNLHYMDANCHEYINGERVITTSKEDANGIKHEYVIGANSNKVYEKSLGRGTQRLLEMSENDKKTSIELGFNAYSQYNPYFGRFVATEISTGRTITCLFDVELKDGRSMYRKWYFRPECQGKLDYYKTVEGDMGIEITKEEFNKLFVAGASYSSSPTDTNVKNKLWEMIGNMKKGESK